MKAFISGCLFTIAISYAIAGQPAPLGKLLSKQFPFMKDDDQTVMLVYFTDKGDAQRYSQQVAKSFISERAISRRSKVRSQDNVIDEQDFPLDRSYVQIVAANVITIRHELKWFNAVSAVATKRQIEAIRLLPFVKEIELVGRWKKKAGDEEESSIKEVPLERTPSGATTLDYGTSFTQVNQINVPAVHNLGIYGQGVMVGMFDNGFRLLSHEAFSSMNIIAQYDFVDHKISVAPNNPSTGFGSHGVNTLSTIGGYAPGQLIGPAFKSSFILARTENDSSETPIEEDNWAKAIEWADSIGVDVTSTSLGYLTYDPPYTSWTWQDMNGSTTLITKAADRAVGLGIVVVNSAGNSGFNAAHNTLNAPADGDSVITAGAVTSTGARTSFSSVGNTTDIPARIKPDIMAMGLSVKVASATNPVGYGSASGTSFSCPLSAGVAALIRCANPTLTPIQVREAMRQTASQSSAPDSLMGWGILNALNAINYYGTLPIGRISGTSFSDLNGNGVRDAGEPTVAGVKIHLSGVMTDSAVTDTLGNYHFDSLAIGNYTLTEDVPVGSVQIVPSGSYSLTLLHGIDTTALNFGNFPNMVYSFSVIAGWNMLSLPLYVLDHQKSSLYPTATSHAFEFESSYTIVDSIRTKVGYWVKFDSNEMITYHGNPRVHDTIDVHTGWNMIGSLFSSVPVASIKQIPDSIIQSNFFTYGVGNYIPITSLSPHLGYFVKSKADGKLVIDTSSARSTTSSSALFPNSDTPFNSITIKDRTRREQTLYFGQSETLERMLDLYELPPPPPAPVFDARFASQRMLEVAQGTQKEIPIIISSAVYPLTLAWKIEQTSASFLLIDGREIPLTTDGNIEVTRPGSTLKLRLASTAGSHTAPKTFALEQNYPNP
ncbi:MAG: S8 family serine peptidase, partial [Ignavibacteriales bacterium]|nr:S8 family serine peptidase [Ignavibacteriales bacterium]